MKEISSADIDAWCKLLKEKMLSDRSFAKEYLKLLVSEIVLTGNELQIKGDSRALVNAVKYTAEKKNLTTSGEVIRFNDVWRATQDENEYWEISLNVNKI